MLAVKQDLELIRRIYSREQAALEELYDKYEQHMYSFAYRIVRDDMMAEEVIQELFLRIWNYSERFDEKQGRLSSWMFTLARHIAIDLLRRRQTRTSKQTVEIEQLSRVADSQSDTQETVEQRMLGHEVRTALTELSDEQQQVVELIYYGGLTQQEVADRQRIPLGTVKSRVRLALKQLKHRLTARERGERR